MRHNMTERLRDTPLGGKLTGLLKSPGENGWGQAWGTSYTDPLFEASVLGSSLATEDHSYSICKQFQCAVKTTVTQYASSFSVQYRHMMLV